VETKDRRLANHDVDVAGPLLHRGRKKFVDEDGSHTLSILEKNRMPSSAGMHLSFSEDTIDPGEPPSSLSGRTAPPPTIEERIHDETSSGRPIGDEETVGPPE
jgi:hypothetical protein